MTSNRETTSRSGTFVAMLVCCLAASAVPVAAVAAATPAGAAAPPEKTCPPGYDLGALTLEQRLQLPKVQAALADGVLTIEQIQAGAARLDKNGNGLLCVQHVPQADNAASPAGFAYFYNLSDDNAAAPSAR